MKLCFVQTIPFEHIGIESISAVLKANNHDCSVVLVGEHKNYLDVVREEKPDMVGFSCITGVHTVLLKYAKEIKKELSLPVILGGPHPSFYPQVIEHESVDYVCRGEGEYALLELMDTLEKGGDVTCIKNLWVKKNGKIHRNELRRLIENLDEIPYPDRTIYYHKYAFLRNSNWKFFRFIRGCPFKCSYCHQHIRARMYKGLGESIGERSPESAIAEIQQFRSRWGLEVAHISDDTFNYHPRWLKEFTERYKREVGLPFVCQGVADLWTEGNLRALKDAGCHAISIGLETASDRVRREILYKTQTAEEIRRAVKLIKEAGILVRTYNMIGIPGETLEEQLNTLKFNVEMQPDIAWASLCQPYPGTDLFRYASEGGYLAHNFSFDQIDITFRNRSEFKAEYKREIVNLQKLFSLIVIFPFLEKFIKLLIKLPLGWLYDKIFYLVYGLKIKQFNKMSFRSIIIDGIRAKKYS